MKIISLAPNITNTLVDMGCEDMIVGSTEHTDVKSNYTVGSWLSPNYKKIKNIDHDIILTSDALQKNIRDEILDMGLSVNHYNLNEFEDLFNLIDSLSNLTGIESDVLKNSIKDRLSNVKSNQPDDSKIVYCEEWDNPTMVAGNWIPDIVYYCGGKYPFLDSGDRSRKINKKEFDSCDPDIFISHICGVSLLDDFRDIRNKWNIKDNLDIYFVDDNYTNQLSSRSIIGVEIFAEIIQDQSYNKSKHYNTKNRF